MKIDSNYQFDLIHYTLPQCFVYVELYKKSDTLSNYVQLKRYLDRYVDSLCNVLYFACIFCNCSNVLSKYKYIGTYYIS